MKNVTYSIEDIAFALGRPVASVRHAINELQPTPAIVHVRNRYDTAVFHAVANKLNKEIVSHAAERK